MTPRLVVACAHCGKRRAIEPARRRTRNFCDRACYDAWRNHGLTAIGTRRADDPYYAARDAARDPHDPDAFDREILLARQREQRLLADR